MVGVSGYWHFGSRSSKVMYVLGKPWKTPRLLVFSVVDSDGDGDDDCDCDCEHIVSSLNTNLVMFSCRIIQSWYDYEIASLV